MERSTAIVALAAMFETRTRDNGDNFVCLRDDAPDWATDVCREAHGDMMPDDTRYSMIREICDAIAENGGDPDGCDDHEICDGLVGVYSSQQSTWLSSHGSRVYYCDDAASEGLLAADADMHTRMAAGWFMEYREIFGQIAGFDYDAIEDGTEDESGEATAIADGQ